MEVIVFFTTNKNLGKVINLWESICRNPSLDNCRLRGFCAYSNGGEANIHMGSLEIIRVPQDFFWAKSLAFLAHFCRTFRSDYLIHLNDDVSPDDVAKADFSKGLEEGNVLYGVFRDRKNSVIFGGHKRFGFKTVRAEKKVEMFNGNFFMCSKEVFDRNLPQYQFRHAFLDFVLSYRIIMREKVALRPIDFTEPVESLEQRKLHFRIHKNIMDSRLNPADAFMYYLLTGRPLLAAPISLYCVLKIILLKLRFFRNG